MTSAVSELERDLEVTVAKRRHERKVARFVDTCLLGGVLISLVLSSIDPSSLGIAEGDSADAGIDVAQRLFTYLPLGVGLLFGVPAARTIRRLPVAAIVLFGAWAVVASAFVAERQGEVDRALWFFAFILLVVMTTIRVGWDRLLLNVAVVGALFVTAGLVAHHLGWLPEIDRQFFDGGLFGIERVRGLADQENSFGRAAAFVALIGVILATARDSSRRLPLGSLLIVVGVIGVLSSQSRFSTISLLFAALIVTARNLPLARIPAALLVIGAGAAVGIVLVTGSLGSLSRSDDASEATSLFGRTAVWEEAIDVSIDHPVVGVGTEGLTRRYSELDDAGTFNWNPTNAHNVVLQTAASHGLVGAWLAITSITIGLGYGFRAQVTGAFEVIVMFVIQGFVESILLGNPTIAPLLLVGALTAISVERASLVSHDG